MLSINKNLAPIKFFYFLIFAGLSPLTAFGPTYASQLGFSTSAIGFIYCVSILLSIFGRLIFGYVADKFKIHKIVLISSVLVCSFSIFLTTLLPGRILPETFLNFGNDSASFEICFQRGDFDHYTNEYDEICELYCERKTYDFLFLKDNINRKNATFVVNINSRFSRSAKTCFSGNRNGEYSTTTADITNSSCFMNCNNERKSLHEEFLQPLFWLLFGAYALYSVTNYVIGVFVDTACFQIIDEEEGEFGNQRMFASMGWGSSALLVGVLTDYISKGESMKNYVPSLFVSFTFLAISGVLLIFFKMPKIKTSARINLEILMTMLWNVKSMIFACWSFFVGVYSAIVWQYSFLIIEEISNKDELSWNKSLQGILVVVNTLLGDVPTYYFFGKIMSRLGYVHCMTLALLLNAARLLAYSLLSNPIWAILVALLDGFTFGVTYATIASYSNLISTPDTKTTIQAIYNCIFDGIGTSIGGLYFGFIYDWYGGAFSFRLGSVIAFISVIAHVIIHRIFSL